MAQAKALATYLSAAKAQYDILKQDYVDNNDPRVFMGSTNYWMAGNVFDTTLDYFQLAIAQNLITPGEIDAVLAYVVKNYDLTTQQYNFGYPYYVSDNGTKGGNTSNDTHPSGWWYDDLAWWGIASSKAFTPAFQPIFKNYLAPFQQIAASCWQVMNKGFSYDPSRPIQWGAPHVWAKCDQTKFKIAAPRVDGGVWQSDINDQMDPFKADVVLGPFQNTVVNALYLVLALRLNGHISTLPNIENEFNFFNTWCFEKSIIQDEQLYLDLSKRAGIWEGIVLERVSTYKDGTAVRPELWHELRCAWTGDQGLMVGAMIDYLQLHPQHEDASNLLLGILNGVPNNLQQNTMLMPWYPLMAGNPLENADAADYASGIGVYMRYLLYGYKYEPTIRHFINTNMYQMRDMIFNNANACLEPGKFPTYGNGLFDLFNQLSTLMLAVYVLQGAEEDGIDIN